MKKLFSMMLMLCAAVAFTACSSEEEEPGNPITNPVVPSSAKIGSEVTIQGSGFSANQTIWLDDANNVGSIPTKIEDFKVTSSGVTFTIPYTLIEGMLARVVVSQNNKDYELGTMTLLAADMPVSAVAVPSEMVLGTKDVTIAGTGFEDGDIVCMSPYDDVNEAYLEMDTKVVDGGVTVDVSTIDLEGTTYIFLKRGETVWKLGETYTYYKRTINTITISGNYMFDLYASAGYFSLPEGETDLKLTVNYDENGALQSVKSNTLESSAIDLNWNLQYEGNKVSFTGAMTGAPYTYTLDEQNRIVSSTALDSYTGEEVKYTWTYDADGYLVSIKADGSDEALLSLVYTDNNLGGYTFVGDCDIKTRSNEISTFRGTVEPMFLLNSFSWIQNKEDLFIGFLLNRNVKISSSVLSEFSAEDYTADLSGIEHKGAEIFAELSENTLTLQIFGDVISSMLGIYANKVVVTYKTPFN